MLLRVALYGLRRTEKASRQTNKQTNKQTNTQRKEKIWRKGKDRRVYRNNERISNQESFKKRGKVKRELGKCQ
jgi:hypothetical protein